MTLTAEAIEAMSLEEYRAALASLPDVDSDELAQLLDDPPSPPANDVIPVARLLEGPRVRVRARLVPSRLEEGEVLAPVDYPDVDRPRTRADCKDGPRPCPFVSCKHHLYLDIDRASGAMKLNFPDAEPWDLKETCALDLADRGWLTLEEIGGVMNLTHEGVRDIEFRGIHRLRAGGAGAALLDAEDADVTSQQPSGELPVSVRDFMSILASHFGLSRGDLRGRSRRRRLAHPRHVAVYLLRKAYGLSYKAIAAQLNRDDHANIIRSYQRAVDDPAIQAEAEAVLNAILGAATE